MLFICKNNKCSILCRNIDGIGRHHAGKTNYNQQEKHQIFSLMCVSQQSQSHTEQ